MKVVGREAAEIVRSAGTTVLEGKLTEGGTKSVKVAEMAAVELVRCLVGDPDNLVVEHALDHLPQAEAVAAVRRLTEARSGRGLILALPGPVLAATRDLFGEAIRFESGRAVTDDPDTISKDPAATFAELPRARTVSGPGRE